MSKETIQAQLAQVAKAIEELDGLRFAEGIDAAERKSIEKRILELRKSESQLIQGNTQAGIKQLEGQMDALKALRQEFEKKWKPIAKAQNVLDRLGRVIHSLLEVSQNVRKLLP